MNFKSGKLYTTIREFDKKNGKYEINGIEDNEAVFLYKEPEKTFTPIPKGNYRITTEDNNRYLNIDNEIERKAERYQVIVTNNLKSSKYEADFPELEVLQEKINLIVEDLENIVSYLKKTGVKTDELSMQQTLPKLEPNTLWVSNENGEIDYIPYSDLNRKFDNMLELLKKTTEETLENKKQQVLSDVEKEKIQQIKAFTQTIETKIREVESYLESHMDEKEQTYSEIFEIKLQEVTGLKSKIEKEIQELEKKTMSALKEEKEQAVSQIERKKETAIKEVSSVVATYFEEHSDELKGPQGEKGPKGAKGDRGLTGPQGERGAGITSVMTLDDNRVLVRYGDEQSEILTIPTVSGKDGKDGKSLEFEWNGTRLGIREQGKYFYNYVNLRGPKGSNGIEGVGLRDVTLTQTGNEVALSFSLTNSTIKEHSFSLAELKLPNYFTKEEAEKQFAPTKHSHDELLSYSEAERVFVSNSFALKNFITIRNVESYCAGKNHNHDELYYAKSKIDEKLGEKSNVVKKVWSGMYTKKGGIVCSLPSGWKVVFIQISWHSDHRGSTTTETLFKDTYQLKGFGVGDEGSSEYTIEIDYYDRVKFTGRGQGDDAAIEAVHVI